VQILHIIGDSHASETIWGSIQIEGLTIICHNLSPMTCASFGLRKDIRDALDINQNDWGCFCFGEIDCRNNIGKHKENYRDIIDKIAENYFDAISQLILNKVFVFNVVPAVRANTAHEGPLIGPDEERREYVRYMNECFAEQCYLYDYVFFNVFDKYTDIDGYFNVEYKDMSVHIANPIFLTEFLLNNI
jgi:hypothetical protein